MSHVINPLSGHQFPEPVHILPCRDDKRPCLQWRNNPWRSNKAAPSNAAFWGLVPSTAGMLVIDVDDCAEPPVELTDILEDVPHSLIQTRKGWHVYVPWPLDEEEPNGQFKMSTLHGDIRHANGYVVMYDPDAVYDFYDVCAELTNDERDATAAIVRSQVLSSPGEVSKDLTLDGEWPAHGRYETLRHCLCTVEPDGEAWLAYVAKAKRSGLEDAKVRKAERSVKLYRETTPWRPSAGAAMRVAGVRFGDPGNVANAFADWLKVTGQSLVRVMGNWHKREGEIYVVADVHDNESAAMAFVDKWLVELCGDPLFAEGKGRQWLAAPRNQRDVLRKLFGRKGFQYVRQDIDQPGFVADARGRVWNDRSWTRPLVDDEPLVTKRMGVDPSPGQCPTWLDFLETQTPGPEVAEWLRAWMRCALSGDVRDIMVFAWGPPGTGKSTFAEVTKAVFGEYATSLQGSQVFNNKSAHPEWTTAFVNTRVVVIAEVPDGAKWDNPLLQSVTSREKIRVRDMYEKAYEHRPHCAMLFTSNYEPVLTKRDGVSRRIRVVHFGRKVDTTYADEWNAKLYSEIPAIAQWVVDLPLQKALNIMRHTPPLMQKALDDYMRSADPLVDALDTLRDTLEVCDGNTLLQWLRERSIVPGWWTMRKLNTHLRGEGIDVVRSGNNWIVQGLRNPMIGDF